MPTSKPSLVDYSDSDSDAASPQPPPSKSLKTAAFLSPKSSSPASDLPPLPSRFHDLYAVAPRVGQADDPALHGGRKRAIPHVQGNWPTHVFVEWHLSRTEFEALDAIYERAKKECESEGIALESHLKSDLGSEQPLHLSLSRPNVLVTEQKEGFRETLEEKLRKSRIKPFTVEFTGFEWVSNLDQTRWFFVLKASKGSGNELPRLLQLTNIAFAIYNQPPLYSQNGAGNDGFHVSLAWSLQKPSKELAEKVSKVLLGENGLAQGVVRKGAKEGMKMKVEAVRVKVGNVVHALELGMGKDLEGGIGGRGNEGRGNGRKRKAE
ncbi:poly(U)-specific 3'-to-5' RNA exonuclease [Rhizina undulata]